MSINVFLIRANQMTSDELADELERIADMVRNGFTSGETVGRGWWETNTVDEDDRKDENGDE